MNALRLHLRPVTWLALVAVLALALMPAVSHALAFARGDRAAWAEVCTPQGIQRVAPGAQEAAPDAPATTGNPLEHCPFCKLGSDDTGAAPTAASAQAEPLPLSPLVPSRFLQAPRTPWTWSAVQPRAPPALG